MISDRRTVAQSRSRCRLTRWSKMIRSLRTLDVPILVRYYKIYVNNRFIRTYYYITYFTSEPSNPSEPSTFLMLVYCNAPSATQLQITIIYRTQKYYSDSLLSDAFIISTAQVWALWLVFLQRLQRLWVRTLFKDSLPSFCPPPSFSAIKSAISPTVRVSAVWIYFLF
jgi:hypothetical protein